MVQADLPVNSVVLDFRLAFLTDSRGGEKKF
jgi:hypothetical protein